MSDLMNALIAAKLMGNGGGGGGSGLPPITPASSATIYEEAALSFTPIVGGIYYALMPNMPDLEGGTTCVITFDGTDYNCVAVAEGGLWYIGNPVFLGMEDTGEPFLITNAESAPDVACFIGVSGTHTVAVAQITTQSPPDGYTMIIENGEWKAGLPEGGTDIIFVDLPLSLKSDVTVTQDTSSGVSLPYTGGNIPADWNTAALVECWVQENNYVCEVLLTAATINCVSEVVTATAMNPFSYDATIYSSGPHIKGYAIKLT